MSYCAQGVKGFDDDDNGFLFRRPNISKKKQTKLHIYIYFPQCHHMPFVDFMVLPPGHGWSVTDI